jgi:hypothetical protein
MRFLITARDISGRITLRRETDAAAMKKAAELAEDGFLEIEITGPDGRQYPPPAFNQLQRMAELRSPIELSKPSQDIPS